MADFALWNWRMTEVSVHGDFLTPFSVLDDFLEPSFN